MSRTSTGSNWGRGKHILEKINRTNGSEAVGAQGNECGAGGGSFKSFRMWIQIFSRALGRHSVKGFYFQRLRSLYRPPSIYRSIDRWEEAERAQCPRRKADTARTAQLEWMEASALGNMTSGLDLKNVVPWWPEVRRTFPERDDNTSENKDKKRNGMTYVRIIISSLVIWQEWQEWGWRELNHVEKAVSLSYRYRGITEAVGRWASFAF